MTTEVTAEELKAMNDKLFAVLDFMELHGFVPVVKKLATWDEIPIKQLKIPSNRTDECYYLRVIDGIVEAIYAKSEVLWRQV